MAKNGNGIDMVEVPVSVLAELNARLAKLEAQANNPDSSRSVLRLDESFERFKEEVGRPCGIRSQENADKRYGTDGRRFRVSLAPGDAKGKNRVDFWPALEISANSDLEAQGRYQQLCGIRGIDTNYVKWLVVEVKEPVAA